MKNFIRFNRLSFLCVVAAMSALMFASSASAQNTSSSIRVNVSDTGGAAAGGVAVTITHTPTGRTQTVTTNNDGSASARGLAIGGPYEVRIAGGDYAADVQQGIFVKLDQTEVVDLVARSSIEEVVVVAQAMTEEVVVGVGSAFDRATIDATPSIGRDFTSTIAREQCCARTSCFLCWPEFPL